MVSYDARVIDYPLRLPPHRPRHAPAHQPAMGPVTPPHTHPITPNAPRPTNRTPFTDYSVLPNDQHPTSPKEWLEGSNSLTKHHTAINLSEGDHSTERRSNQPSEATPSQHELPSNEQSLLTPSARRATILFHFLDSSIAFGNGHGHRHRYSPRGQPC